MTEGCVPQKGGELIVITVAITTIMLCGKKWEETRMSTAELKMVPGQEFTFRHTHSQTCISKR